MGNREIDYALIRQTLEALYEIHPGRKYWKDIPCLACLSDKMALSFLSYLDEHGMIQIEVSRRLGGHMAAGKMEITARGIDFIQPDGGLSALAAPVIRIAPESLVAIIDEALAARGIPEEDRLTVKKSLGIAGEEGIRSVVGRLVEAGATHAPDILRLLGFF